MIRCLEHMVVINVESTGPETTVGEILVIVVTVLMCGSMCILTTAMSTCQVHGALVLELTYFTLHLLATGCIL